MSVLEFLPALKTLFRAKKPEVMQFLVQELTLKEEVSLLQLGIDGFIFNWIQLLNRLNIIPVFINPVFDYRTFFFISKEICEI